MIIPRDPVMSDEDLEELYALEHTPPEKCADLWLLTGFAGTLLLILALYGVGGYVVYRILRGIVK